LFAVFAVFGSELKLITVDMTSLLRSVASIRDTQLRTDPWHALVPLQLLMARKSLMQCPSKVRLHGELVKHLS
jgi:hypothetical protein